MSSTTEELTPEEEKKKREKLQLESDLAVAMETFGVSKGGGVESMNPNNEEEFNTFRDALVDLIVTHKVCTHLEHLLCPL